MIFQVSTGRSASLNDQSNFSSALGSSVGSWYGARYGWASASSALTRFLGSKTSMFSSRSMAVFGELVDVARLSAQRTLCFGISELVGQRLPLALGQ